VITTETNFYESVEVPTRQAQRFSHIFFLRNFFQAPELFENEFQELEHELKELLPVLDPVEAHVEQYQPGEMPLSAIKDLLATAVRPIVFRKLGAEHECVQKWRPEMFKEQYGDFPIFYTSTESIVNDNKTRLADFVDQVLSGNVNRGYIENLSDIFNEFPQLHDELGLDRIAEHFKGFATYHQIAQLFFGGRGTGAAFHCANELNCFFNIYGQKHWTFVHPRYGFAMYPSLMNRGYFIGSFVKANAPAGFIEANFPLYNRVPRLAVTLEPGDILINPPWWWHTVKNVSPSTIAVATRWGLKHRYRSQAPVCDFVQSMRVDTWTAFDEDFLKTVVVVPDARVRKNYVSYEQMGWKRS